MSNYQYIPSPDNSRLLKRNGETRLYKWGTVQKDWKCAVTGKLIRKGSNAFIPQIRDAKDHISREGMRKLWKENLVKLQK